LQRIASLNREMQYRFVGWREDANGITAIIADNEKRGGGENRRWKVKLYSVDTRGSSRRKVNNRPLENPGTTNTTTK
jgi:hypothetical protein